MSLENPPEIPFELAKTMADLLEERVKYFSVGKDWMTEADLAVQEYKDWLALNG